MVGGRLYYANQLPMANWFEMLENNASADALLDRVINTATRFTLDIKV